MLTAQLAIAQGGAARKDTAVLKTKNDSLQYALGVYMGNYLINGGFSEIDLELFVMGLAEKYRGNRRPISDSAAYRIISKYQEETSERRHRFLEEQLFETLKTKKDVGRLPSGVQFLVVKPGTGPKPQETDTVVVHYKGTLPNGDVFENTFLANTPITTTPSNLVGGLREVVQLMPVGSTYEVFIPSALAYGPKGNGRIPPNSALIVTIELVRIKK